MKNGIFMFCIGLAAGMYVAYTHEDELEKICRKTKKARRKMTKKMHCMEDGICDYLDIH